MQQKEYFVCVDTKQYIKTVLLYYLKFNINLDTRHRQLLNINPTCFYNMIFCINGPKVASEMCETIY